MAQIIGLPKLSPTMEEGVLVKWVKREGDSVEPGELVAEVETDKANMDFNLEDEGVLLKLLVEEGATVPLGAPVAILGELGEDISALVEEAKALLAGSAASAATAATPPAGARLLASPLAKTLALETGIDLRALAGSGPGGRIVERDVRAAIAAAAATTAAPSIAPTAMDPPEASTALALRAPLAPPARIPPSDEYVDKPLSGVRKRIAERMTAAMRDVPHFYLTREINAGPLLAFRRRLNDLLADRGKVSVNDLLIKAVALSLRRVPDCNVSFTGDAIRYYTGVHIGVAVATERGLLTPVIRDADLKGLGVISKEIRDLAKRARNREIKVHEIQGSTFTISNLGMMGISHFEAIINPPEAGIIALGAIEERPVIVDGSLAIGKRMSATLSCDHRVIDGALGARLLHELADIVERPESLAL